MIVLLNIQTLDGDFFDQMRGYFTTLGQVEVDACKNAMAGFETVVSQANTVSIVDDSCIHCRPDYYPLEI